MNGENARPGVAHIIRELGADSWSESDDGFVVSVRMKGRRRCKNYLVTRKQLEPIEGALATDTNPLRVSTKDFRRLDDSDC